MASSFTVRRLRLGTQGYEYGTSRYFGSGAPIFAAFDRETGDELARVRAWDRASALVILAGYVAQVRAFGAYRDPAHGWCRP